MSLGRLRGAECLALDGVLRPSVQVPIQVSWPNGPFPCGQARSSRQFNNTPSPGTGGSQSWTTVMAGGEAWTAEEGTYTVPPTSLPPTGGSGGSGGSGGGNGEEACEGHSYSESQCSAVGCCQWDQGEVRMFLIFPFDGSPSLHILSVLVCCGRWPLLFRRIHRSRLDLPSATFATIATCPPGCTCPDQGSSLPEATTGHALL